MSYQPDKLYALTAQLLTELDRDIRLAHTLAGAGLVETRTADGLRVLSLAPTLPETSSASTSSYHSSSLSSSIDPSSSSMGEGTSSVSSVSSAPPYSSFGSSFVSSGP